MCKSRKIRPFSDSFFWIMRSEEAPVLGNDCNLVSIAHLIRRHFVIGTLTSLVL